MVPPTKHSAPTLIHWRTFLGELWSRTWRPFSYPSFIIFFLVAVVLLGGGGVWLEVWNWHFPSPLPPGETSALRVSIITFFFALAGSSSMQLVMEEDNQKSLKALALLVCVSACVLAFVVSNDRLPPDRALSIASAAACVSLWVWWVANANQKDLQDPDVPAGGSVDKPLAGDLGDYRVS